MDHDAFDRSGSSHDPAMLDRDAYVPVNYISPDAYALLLATEAAAARRVDAYVSGSGPTLQSALGGLYDTVRDFRTMAPPKRYYRISWESISLRLLDQPAHMKPSISRSGEVA